MSSSAGGSGERPGIGLRLLTFGTSGKRRRRSKTVDTDVVKVASGTAVTAPGSGPSTQPSHPGYSPLLPSSSSSTYPSTTRKANTATTTTATAKTMTAEIRDRLPPSANHPIIGGHPPSPPSSQQHQTTNALRTWWQRFNTAQKFKPGPMPDKDDSPHPVFGKPLKDSLRYASVQISTAGANGELYVWGYIPVVVAKCGLFLKENATEVEGTFRVNGSNKRMRELQAIFETPPRYGKSVDWKKENYTSHDVASVFRRYLTQMPEPVIPHDMYFQFRDAIAKKPYNQDDVIATYKRLIAHMPRANQYLLLYVLDLLSVFARKSDKNLMTAQNLAVIFRPGIISHPSHELSPTEHQLSQDVLEFLIAHQDWFMMSVPAAATSASSATHPGDLSHPGSEEEDQGWSVVGAPGVVRRRTTVDHDRTSITGERSAELTPVDESPSPGFGPVSVTRSRTLPSQRSDESTPTTGGGAGGGAGGGSGGTGRVLRKARHASGVPVAPSPPESVGSHARSGAGGRKSRSPLRPGTAGAQ